MIATSTYNLSVVEDLRYDVFLKVEKQRVELLENIIRQVTGTTGDPLQFVKDFSLVQHNLFPGREWVSYKGNIVGEISITQAYSEEKNSYSIGYEFMPCNKIEPR